MVGSRWYVSFLELVCVCVSKIIGGGSIKLVFDMQTLVFRQNPG